MTTRRLLLGFAALLGLGALALSMTLGASDADRAEAASLPALPANWPSNQLQLGVFDAPGGASALRQSAPYGFRYQYLAGGVNTGNGWANWNANGDFVRYYIEDSVANGFTPVFTYYMIYQSSPGNTQGESSGVYNNLQNSSTMAAYYNDLKLFFQKANQTGSTAVLHVEPDMWAYLQQRSSGDNAASVPAKVAGSGLPELAGLPDNVAGMAQGIKKLRDTYGPRVILAYHMSIWGTGNDIVYTNPSDSTIDSLSARAANYYLSLGADYDVVFTDWTDRDAAFKQYQYGDGGAAWWDSGDYARNLRFLSNFVATSGERVVVWQIPFGNTKMRAMNNTWNHYQDNKVEWLLDDPSRAHLNDYVQAGVIGFLFGRGADGATCACDANNDGVTNPPAINGNTASSYNADDDGGFFKNRAAAYYATGAMSLSGGASSPINTPTNTPTTAPTKTPTPGSTATATATPIVPLPTPTVTQPPSSSWSSTATVSSSTVRRGRTQGITARVTAPTSGSYLVDIEVYSPSGQKVYQAFFDNRYLSAGSVEQFQTSWRVPSNAQRGTYTVKIGVFAPGWSQLLNWNDSARTFNVR